MKRVFILFLLYFVLFNFNSFAQRGKNGAKTVTAINTIVNEYTALSANATAGVTSISVLSNTLNANGRFTSSLAQGDLIFIIQMQGASLLTGYSGWNGFISSYGYAGVYEFAEVLSVSGATTITLECGLTNNYTSAAKVQIVRVPRYTSLTVNAGAELTCDTWNGTIGGVLVVETFGTVTNNGSIIATGKGSRGGAVSADCDNVWGPYAYASTDNTLGGQKGEGIAGYGSTDGQYCRACAANGGGGGNAHNCGGGGGSNASYNFAYNGCGFPDTTTSATYKQAWDLEAATPDLGFCPSGISGFHKNASYGGGKGGYSFSSSNADALTAGPENAAWTGDYRRNNGGFGGFPLNVNEAGLSRLFMGGGGGGGSQNDNFGGAGGNGGGIIYLMTYGSVSGAGTVISNGSPGVNSAGTAPLSAHAGVDGSGGGGGGGAIVLNATGTITGNSSQANGGSGGNQLKSKGTLAAVNSEAEGPGGGGGGGYIAISASAITRTATGGVNGTSSSSSGATDIGVSEFPPNGATKGGPGIDNATVTNFTITAPDVNTCTGVAATLTATLSGTIPSGISYGWYNAQFGGTLLSNTLTLVVPNPTTTTTYYFRTCPGTYAVPVVLNVNPSLPITVTATPASICLGQSSVLLATGATTYTWMPGSLSGSTTTVTPGGTTTYTVTGTSTGCSGSNTVTVTVNPLPTIIGSLTVCVGSNTQLTGSGTPASTNPWVSANTLVATVSNTGMVTVITIGTSVITYTNNNGCSISATVTVVAAPTIVGTPNMCIGSSTQLTGSGTPSATNPWVSASPLVASASNTGLITGLTAGTSVITFTSNSGCSIAVTVTVNPLPTITGTLNVCAGSTTQLTGSATAASTNAWVSASPLIASISATGLVTGLASGTSVITYTNNAGCSITALITVNPLPTITGSLNVCFGSTTQLTGSGIAAATNPWVSASPLVAIVSSTGLVTGSTSGTSVITYTNNNGCIATATVTVNPLPSITGTLNVCVGSTTQLTGSGTAASTNPWVSASPLVASVSSTGLVTGLTTGSSIITYTNSNGCSITATITVNALNNPAFNYSPSTFCQSGTDPIANITGGATGSFSASPVGLVFTNTSTGGIDLSASAINTYTITFTTTGACPSSGTATITITTAPLATFSYSGPYCQEMPNPSPTFTAGASSGVFSALPIGLVFVNTNTGQVNLASSSPGTYTVTNNIIASGGCAAATATNSITINPTPTIIGSYTVCVGSNSQLTGSGTPASTNPWVSASPLIATVSNTGMVTVSAIGTSVITYTNNFGCSTSVTISVVAAPTITGILSVCAGSTTQLTGTGTAAATNPWVSANPLVANVSTTGLVTGLTAGSSLITYTNTSGCSVAVTVTISALPTITGIVNVCLGSTTQLTGSGIAAATNPWVSASPLIASVNTTGLVTAVAIGTSVITYTNNGGCSTTATITVNPLPTITGALTVCVGSTTQLTGSGTATTSNPWVSGSPLVASVSNTGLVTGLTAGTSSITYTNNSGCSYTANITVNPLPTITGTLSVCVGSSTQLTGSGTAALANPWVSASPIVASVNTTGLVSGLSVGTSIITYTNSNGCSITATVTVNALSNPAFNYSPSTFCQSGTDPVANITGGATGTFSASPAGLVFTNTSTGGIDLSASAINTYTITFATSGACPSSGTSTITITTSPAATFSYSGPYCHGAANPSPTFSAGASAGVFTASPAGLVFVSSSTGQVNLATSASGTFTVTNTIAASGGCAAATASNTIIINPTPTVTVPANIVVCSGAAVPASNFVTTPSGGSFTWTNSNGTIGLPTAGTGNVPAFTAINGGTGSITATITVTPTANTCQGTPATYTITINPHANATITPHTPLCANAAPITFSAVQTGGAWSGAGITNAASGTFNPATAGAGNIQIIYTIAGACGDADTTHIIVNPLPIVNLGHDTTICNGSTLVLNAGNAGSTYVWTPSGALTQTITVSSAGTYSVQVTNANTCVNTASIQVNFSANANATITAVNPMCSNVAAFNLVAAQSGGTWSGAGITNATLGTFSPAAAGSGTSQVIYNIAGACGDDDTVSITVYAVPALSIDSVNPGCPDFNQGSIALQVVGGMAPFTYNWNSGETSTVLTNLHLGTYTVTVTDNNQCVVVRSIDLAPPLVDCFEPVIYIPNIFSPNGDGNNDVVFVHGEGVKSLSFQIFDRWGEKVFETTDIKVGWDGTIRGKDAAEAVYAYQLHATMNDGTTVKRKGNISLVR
ncbi:MAG: Ig-like domain-containing protein [Bacteroidota bacterium]